MKRQVDGRRARAQSYAVRTSVYSAKAFSKAVVFGPSPSHPDRSTSAAAAMASSEMRAGKEECSRETDGLENLVGHLDRR